MSDRPDLLEALARELVCVFCAQPAAVVLAVVPDEPDVPTVIGAFCGPCWLLRGEHERAA